MSIKDFNQTAQEFLSSMSKTFPQEEKIKQYLYKFEMVKSMNAKMPVEMFMENMRPFGLQIMGKNEIFFKKDQYVKQAESISGKMGLLQYWETMPEETQETIWKYVQTLYVLGMNILGLTEELKSIYRQVHEQNN